MFMSGIHFGLIYVYGLRQRFYFIILHTDIQIKPVLLKIRTTHFLLNVFGDLVENQSTKKKK